jgi:phenylalanyl-tRNA synthetase beta chain
MSDLAGGKVEGGVVNVAAEAPARKPFRFRPSRVNRVLGTKLPESRIWDIVKGLGCVPQGDAVLPPPLRRDIKVEVDLIEEVARIDGYDRIPSDTSFPQRVAVDRRDDLIREELRARLTSMGCFEVCTWSFSTNSVNFWGKTDQLVPLMDPTTGRVDRTLRNALGPGLVEVLKTNEDYKERLAPVFEIADVYFPVQTGYGERRILGIASPRGFAHLRGLVENAVPGARVAKNRVWVDDLQVGYIASVETELRCDVAVAEIDFDSPVDLVKLDRRFKAFSRMPPVVRDLALVVAESVAWEEIVTCVRKAAPKTLESVDLFDIYRGKPIAAGEKSVAFSITFRAPDRTLTSEEVESAVKGIVGALASQCKGRLR